jgi:hypothetical protein
MAGSPTRDAEAACNTAYQFFFPIYTGGKSGDLANLAMGLSQLANGIRHLSVGVRATYQKLEEIEKRLNMPR